MSTAITNLAEVLPVSPGAIASKPLVDLVGGFKLVLFSMDQGQEISTHSAPFPATVLCLAGTLNVMVNGTWTTLEAGMRHELPEGIPHGVKATLPSHWLLMMFRQT